MLTKWGEVSITFDKMGFVEGVSDAISLGCCFVIRVCNASFRGIINRIPDILKKNLRVDYEIAQNVIRKDFAFIPVMIEDCSYGVFYLSNLVRYDLFNDFEEELDNLAVALGGSSLSDPNAIDRSNMEAKRSNGLMGRAETSFYAGDYAKSIITWSFDFLIGQCQRLGNAQS